MDILNNLKNTLKVNSCTFAKKFASASILLFMLFIVPIKVSAYDLPTTAGFTSFNSSGTRDDYYSRHFFNSTDKVYITQLYMTDVFNNFNNSLEVGKKYCFNMNHTITFSDNVTSFNNVHSLNNEVLNYNDYPKLDFEFTTSRIIYSLNYNIYKYDVVGDINTKSITSDIYFSIVDNSSNLYKLSDIYRFSISFHPTSNKNSNKTISFYDLSPYSNMSVSSNQGSHRINYLKMVSCDSAPFVESSSEGGDNKVSNTILLSISIGVFCIFLYLVIRELFRR